MKKIFFTIAYISIFSILILIFVGASVRMLGAGMGCPDWPKCYGYYIPPANEGKIKWKTYHHFKKGQMILKQNQLLVAKDDFITKQKFNKSNWDIYYDYHVFNPWNTLVEFINRIFGAITGFIIFILFLYSVFILVVYKKIMPFVLSSIMLIMVIFQAWLGALVVYSNLKPLKVTFHMLVALLMLLFNVFIINRSRRENIIISKNDRFFVALNYIFSFLVLIQIFLGSQVRQNVDKVINYLSRDAYINKHIWLSESNYFYIHRSFSIFIVLFLIYMWVVNYYKKIKYHKYLKYLTIMVSLNVMTGIFMRYFNFPILSQPTHLVLSFILIAINFKFLISSKAKKQIKDKN